MEKKNLGDKLILIGIILSIGAVPLYLISAMIWEISLLGFTIDIIIIIIGLTSIIIGGIWAKKSRDYWFVLIGLILILGGLFLESINITTNLIGIQPFIPYPISPMMWGMGIIFAIVGGLMKKE
ncbi:MAG: hypothetical protein ACFFBI_03170 [Promethearchaeota archaeon]